MYTVATLNRSFPKIQPLSPCFSLHSRSPAQRELFPKMQPSSPMFYIHDISIVPTIYDE